MGPNLSIHDFNSSQIYDIWMGIITPGAGGVIVCPRRRSIAAMIRKMMQVAQSVHDRRGALPDVDLLVASP